MTPTTSVHNSLFFDILGHIFSHYVEDETIFRPLETLLLVCKTWHNAALGHHALWGKLKIFLGHKPTHQIWRTRLPLRLARSGNAPLSIDLRNCLSSRFEQLEEEFKINPFYSMFICPNNLQDGKNCCSCHLEAETCAQDLLVLLAGPDGEYCSRWVMLELRMRTGDSETGERVFGTGAVRALSYPTPRLSSIWLMEVRIDKSPEDPIIFPFTPSLTAFELEHSFLPMFPDLRNADDIGFSWDEDDTLEEFNPSNMMQASGVERLRLNLPPGFDIPLPLEMPFLVTLCMHEASLPLDLSKSSMPNLRALYYTIHSASLLSQLLTFQGLPFSYLEYLYLRWQPKDRDEGPEIRNALRNVLHACTSLDELVGDEGAIAVSLKIFWEGVPKDVAITEGRSVRIEGNWRVPRPWVSAKLTKSSTSAAARALKLPPLTQSWDQILEFAFRSSSAYNTS